jgi:hypothetical protein
MAIIYKVKELKTCLRAMVCSSKINVSKPDKESIRKENDIMGTKVPSIAEFNMWIASMAN